MLPVNSISICTFIHTINKKFQYENCREKFFKHDNVELLQYLGRAYFKAGMLKEAKRVFLKVSKLKFVLITWLHGFPNNFFDFRLEE